jgi:predicted ATPase/class 3 adenylate cyclase
MFQRTSFSTASDPVTLRVDAAPLVALADRRDPQQETIERLLLEERGPLVVPAPAGRLLHPGARGYVDDLVSCYNHNAAMSDLPSGTVTLLFTDIEGSTRLLERLGGEYEQVLAEHRRLIREAVVAHTGVEIDTQGDAFLCAFGRASDAVAAAADAQRSLAQTPMRVRMGIHTGEPTLTAEGYVGVDLHRGARVMAAGHGGQVLISRTTRDLLGDVPVRDLGEHRLKDLSEPQRLYQLVAEGLDSDFPPPKTLENRPTNLPTQPTPLVGRERELEEVTELLCREQVRLATLTGPGGTGKTRLALQAAAELVEDYSDGVWFVNLAALSDAELVLPTIAQTLGVKEQPGEPIAETLGHKLAEQELLLVLDNFEQVLEAADALSQLLAQVPRLNLIVTSRSPLRLQGEHEYGVPPLGSEEALALFVERAQAAKASFSLNGNRPVVAEICRRLDQLPLAIELAAARIKLLPEAALLERLDQKLKVLTGGARDLDERQRTLRAAIDWSYELLSEEEQILFRRLAVFTGGRTLETIEAICSPEGELDVFEGIASLIDKSLLRQEETEEREPRFVMLETIHEYAREKLDACGEAEELQRRHADFFLVFAKQEDVDESLAHLHAERENLRTALETFARRGPPERELELATTLSAFWYMAGPAADGREALSAALARAGDAPDDLRRRALNALGSLSYFCGCYEEAFEASEAALELARRSEDAVEIIRAAGNLGLDYLGRQDFERALPLFEEAVRLSFELAEPRWIASSTGNLGYARLVAGRLEGAADALSDSAGTARQIGDSVVEGVSLFNLGLVHVHLGELDDARRDFADSLRSSERGRMRSGVAAALLGLAAVAERDGEPLRAAKLLGSCDAMLEEIQVSLEPYEQRLRDETHASLEGMLGEAEAREALEAGRHFGPDEAVEYALAHEAQAPDSP